MEVSEGRELDNCSLTDLIRQPSKRKMPETQAQAGQGMTPKIRKVVLGCRHAKETVA
jgi:hypothetical protein